MRINYFAFLIFSVFIVSLYSKSQDKLFLKSGEILNGKISNSDLHFSTNYGDVLIPPSYIISIDFTDQDCKITTKYNEYITGHIKDSSIKLDVGGSVLNIQKEYLERLYVSYRNREKKIYFSYFEMKNDDKLYGKILNTVFKLTTSYGTIDIDFINIVKIEDIDGQTKVYLKNGNIMQGFIASPELLVKLNYGKKVKVPKSSIKIVDMQ